MKKINNLLIFVISVVGFIPFAFLVPFTRAWGIVAMVIWILLRLITFAIERAGKISLYELTGYSFLIYVVIVSYVSGNEMLAHRYIELFGMFVLYFSSSTTDKRAKYSWPLILIFLILATIAYGTTVSELFSNPFAARSIKTSDTDTIDLLSRGVGGYSFIYGFAFAGLISIGLFLTDLMNGGPSLPRRYLVSMFFGYLLALLLAVLANYLTAIIMLIVSPLIIVAAFSVRKMSSSSFAILSIAIVLSIVFWKPLLLIVDDVITSILGVSWTSERIQMIFGFLAQGDSMEDLTGARAGLSQISWRSALDNPLGGLVLTSYVFANDQFEMIGQHSFILDTAAAFGFPVASVLVYLIVMPFLRIVRTNRGLGRWLSIVVMFFTLIFFIINNATISIGIAVYYLFPRLIHLTLRRRML